MEAKRLHLRDATRNDTAAIIGLLNQTFRTPIDAATWQWYVYDNPLGTSRIYLADDDTGTLVGVIGFAPLALRLEGHRARADFAHHLVLTPAYRDTLSFVQLNRHALNAQAALGVELVIGPPNRTAYPIHKTIMKWVDFGWLDCLRKLKPSAQTHACREIDRFTSAFNPLYERVSSSLSFCVEKDEAWMNWRFCHRPGSPYKVFAVGESDRLDGYVVLKSWQDREGYRKAHILDLHAINDHSLSQLVAAAETYADGYDELNLWAVQGYCYRSALEARGFAPNAAAKQPLIARRYDGSKPVYPSGACSLMYGDGDTLY
jgi:hypothetical protein